MSWIELDDRILDHPKFIRAIKQGGAEALFLWLGMRSYCAQLLTDGFVPTDMLDEVRGPREPKKRLVALTALVDARLLDPADRGYQMHDYLEWSSSRADVLDRRKSSRDRKRRHRGTDDGVREESRRDGDENPPGVTNPRGRVSPPIPSPPVSSLSSPGSLSPPDQTHAQSNGGADGPAILPPPTRHRTARIGTLTPAFLDLFERYPRRDKRMEASQVFAEMAETYPGGEAALAAAIGAAFSAGMLNHHPYRGPNDTRPCFDRFLAERRWEDPVSAPDDIEPPKPSRPWLEADKAREAAASHARMEGRRVLAELAAAEKAAEQTAAGGSR